MIFLANVILLCVSLTVLLLCCLYFRNSDNIPDVSPSVSVPDKDTEEEKLERKETIAPKFQISDIVRSTQWEIPGYVWGYGLALESDICQMKSRNPYEYFQTAPSFHKSDYDDIKPGDVVFVCADMIPWFCENVLDDIRMKIILIVGLSDNSFPDDCGENVVKLLHSPFIHHIFAQNFHFHSEWSDKVTHIPIGVDFHTPAYKRNPRFLEFDQYLPPLYQEQLLNQIVEGLLPTQQRKVSAFVDFQHFDSMKEGCFHRDIQFGENRTDIFQTLVANGVVEYDVEWRKRSMLWQKKGQYAFSISPHGNGLDCHRTWEDLILGCIVIVKTSPLDLLYRDLPVVIVQDWKDVTLDNMNIWLAQYGDMGKSPKLMRNYWVDLIRTRKTEIV